MNILALNPKDFYTGWPVQSDFGRELYRAAALTFPLLKRLLPPGHDMRFIEGFFDPIPMSDYMAAIKWADVVLFKIEASCGAISYAVAVQQVKRLNPGAFIIAGGHHANMFRERWLSLGIDLIVTGEAERIFADLIEEVAGSRQFDRIDGLAFMKDGEYVKTPDVPLLESLDESPVPDWDLLNMELYNVRIDPGGGLCASIETSRGCIFRCNFCAVPPYWRYSQRYKSIGRVMEEIDMLLKRGVTTLSIVDDGFGNSPDYTNELVDAIGRYRGRLVWQSFMRADTILADPGLIDRSAHNGWRRTLLGFESLNPNTLSECFAKGMRARATLEDYQEMYQRLRSNKVMVVGVFISGHPGITDSMKTSYLDARTVCDDPRLADYMPLPGTSGYEELAAEYHVKDMFFHDAKVPVFPWHKVEALKFNLFNTIDIPRIMKMLYRSHHHRTYLIMTYYHLLSKLLRINRRKLRDMRLLRRNDISPDQRQSMLIDYYLNDPEYLKWLDSQTSRVWM